MPKPVLAIMAGGRGERFWPRSRRNYPKQLINLVGEASLLQQSVERVRPLTEDSRIFIITNQDYVSEVRKQLPMLPQQNILVEPEGRNTAPCVGLAALYIRRYFPGEDPALAILPSDSLVYNQVEMRNVLKVGLDYIRNNDSGVIFGMWPTRPETGYGYIRLGEEIETQGEVRIHRVSAFTEKPNLETAEQYLWSKEYLWNAGIFVWRVSSLMAEIERTLPDLAAGLRDLRPFIGTAEEDAKLKEVYPKLPAISVDYGILEKSTNLKVIPTGFGWDDLGNWGSLERYLPKDQDGNVVQGTLAGVDCKDCIIYSPKKLVAALGVRDLIVVEADDVLMICTKDKVQEIKKLLEKVKQSGRTDLL